MSTSEIHETIDNELKRVQTQNHSNYAAWYRSLRPYARSVVDLLLEEDVTPELITYAQNVPEEEYEEYVFLRMIGGGNPIPSNMLGLTNLVLDEILYDVMNFGEDE